MPVYVAAFGRKTFHHTRAVKNLHAAKWGSKIVKAERIRVEGRGGLRVGWLKNRRPHACFVRCLCMRNRLTPQDTLSAHTGGDKVWIVVLGATASKRIKVQGVDKVVVTLASMVFGCT